MSDADRYRPEKALVTGGAGFIGANLVRVLLDEGVAVRVLCVPGDPAPNLSEVRSRIEVVSGDLLDPASLDAAMAGCDTLFHLAAIFAIWLPIPRRMFDVNIEGTRNVMAAAQRAGVRRIVHTSSIAAVGSRAPGQLASEEDHFNEWDVSDDYVISKYVSELEVHRLVKDGLPAVIVNPAFPFGWGDVGPTPTGGLVEKLLQGFPVFADGGFNAVGVRDVARGHWLAALRGQVGRRYILGGENMTYGDFAQRVARAAGVRAPRFKISRGAFVRLGKLGDLIADHITRKAPVAAERTVSYIVGRYLYFDCARARTELGYAPEPIEVHIDEAVRWFRAQLGKGS